MSSIDPNINPYVPIQPSTPSNLPSSPQSPPIDSISSFLTTDPSNTNLDLKIAQPQLPFPNSILSYKTLVDTSIQDLQEQLYETNRNAFSSNFEALLGIIADAESLIALYTSVTQLGENAAAITLSGYNALINNMNSLSNSNMTQSNLPDTPPGSGNQTGGDIVQVQDLNALIAGYNAIPQTVTQAQLQTAVDTYNAYVTARNLQIDAYNQAVSNFPAAIQNQNTLLAPEIEAYNMLAVTLGEPPFSTAGLGSGLVPIPQLPLATITLAPPMTPLTVPNPIQEPIIGNLSLPTTQQFIDRLFTPGAVTLLESFINYLQSYQLAQEYIENQQYQPLGKNIVFPDAFITVQQQSSNSGIGGNPSLGANLNTVSALESNHLASALSKGVLQTVSQLVRVPESNTLYHLTLALALQVLTRLGLLSGKPSGGTTGDGSTIIGGGGLPVQVGIASAFLSLATDVVSSNAIAGGIKNAVYGELLDSASLGQAAQAARSITAGINLSLLGFAALQIASSLNLPGLIPQLFGTIQGIPSESVYAPSTNASQLNNVLGNSLSRSILESRLAQQIQSDQAFYIAKAAVADAASNPVESTSGLENTLSSQLSNQGIDPSQSSALATDAVNFLLNEARLPYLDTLFNGASVNQASLIDTLATTLSYRGYDINSATLLLNDPIRRALDARSNTNREFREALERELRAANLNPATSSLLSNQAVQFAETGTLGQSIGNQSINVGLASNSIINDLLSQGIPSNQASQIASATLQATAANAPFASVEEYQNALATEMTNGSTTYGVPISGSASIAANATQSAITWPAQLTPDQLAQNLSSEVINALTPAVGLRQAQLIANSLASNLTGNGGENPNSLANLLHEEIRGLQSEHNQKIDNTIRDQLKTFINPQLDVLILNKQLTEPASLLNESLAGPVPNYKRDITIEGIKSP